MSRSTQPRFSGKDFYCNKITPLEYLAENINGDCDSARMIARIVRQFIPEEKRGLLVELGCGPGESLKHFFFNTTFKEYILVDVSEKMIRHAETKYKRNGAIISSFTADLENDSLQIGDGKSDAISCSSTVFYLKELKNLFREAQRVLKPGGLFLFDMLLSPHEFTYPNWKLVKCYAHTQTQLKEALGLTSFKLIKTETVQDECISVGKKLADQKLLVLQKK